MLLWYILSPFYYKTGTMGRIGSTSYVLPIRLSYRTLKRVIRVCGLPRYVYLVYGKYSLFTLRHVPCVSWGYISIWVSLLNSYLVGESGQFPVDKVMRYYCILQSSKRSWVQWPVLKLHLRENLVWFRC